MIVGYFLCLFCEMILASQPCKLYKRNILCYKYKFESQETKHTQSGAKTSTQIPDMMTVTIQMHTNHSNVCVTVANTIQIL